MSQIFPFRGYRYNDLQVGQIGDVVTQPYDKITRDQAQRYLQRHPYNVVRITKNSNYAEAARYLNHWIKEGVLLQDPTPCIYPYEQTFEFEGNTFSRLGFICLMSVENNPSVVKGHEQVLSEPLQDRLNLLRATESNQGLVFMLYSDPELEVDELLAATTQNEAALAEVVDEYDVVHRMWCISDLETQTRLSAALQDQPFYIADGHHRFQTAIQFCRECREKGWKTSAVESFDKRMVALFNMESPSLKILPTHRGLRNLPEVLLNEFPARLEEYFTTTQVPDVPVLRTAMSGPGKHIGLAIGPQRRIYVLSLKDSASQDPQFMPETTGPARKLDVNILHEGILKPMLGIGSAELASQRNVDYHRSQEELLQRTFAGECQLAFFLNPTTLEQVREISELGQKMPQKSTDFYPKLLTGLVLAKMEIVKAAKL